MCMCVLCVCVVRGCKLIAINGCVCVWIIVDKCILFVCTDINCVCTVFVVSI